MHDCCPTCTCLGNPYKNYPIYAIRTSGEFGNRAEKHIQSILPDLQKPSQSQTTYSNRSFDFYLPTKKLRIEVKATRIKNSKTKGTIINRAVASTSSDRFITEFHQIKPTYFDVLILVAVWKDTITYWAIPSLDFLNGTFPAPLTNSHRGGIEKSMRLGPEGMKLLDRYKVTRGMLRGRFGEVTVSN